ncbi:MAG: isopentenyl phosphate kinase [Anaerolineales bacterium]
METRKLLFLKLGGSLITDKTRPITPRIDVLARLAHEIVDARIQNPNVQLILGHGSGSFGHVPAKKHGTRQGVTTPAGWRGFSEVWLQASALTRFVVNALHEARLPAVVFPPFAGAIAHHRKIAAWDLAPIRTALDVGLLPVVHGDVAFDTGQGGTILSTEDVFTYLARHLHPARILIAGIEPGVWADYPACTRIIPEITPETLEKIAPVLGGSPATDVTGGMASKVRDMSNLCQEIPGLDALIFSGRRPGQVRDALLGNRAGTRIYSEKQ